MKEHESEFEEKKIDLEASKWVSKRTRGFTAAEQDQFFEWLAKDPRHAQWYGVHLNTWKQLDKLAEWKPEHSEQANPHLLRFRSRQHMWYTFGGFGIAAALLIALLSTQPKFANEQVESGYHVKDIVAHTYEEHQLPDGSFVEMKNGAAIKVNYSHEERRVELVSSEAHFEVESNPDVPFIVQARDVEIKAVGTAFSVSISDNEVELLVTEGKVEVYKQSAESDEEVMVPLAQNVEAGQKTVVSTDDIEPDVKVQEVTSQQMDEMLGWKPKRLNFDEVPLSEVVSEFNRRNGYKIHIGDPELENILIVASFHSADTHKLVCLLEGTLDIQANFETNRVVLFR